MALTRKQAFGNKRQKQKIRRFLAAGCGCWFCCRPDRREILRKRIAKREV